MRERKSVKESRKGLTADKIDKNSIGLGTEKEKKKKKR